MPPKIKNAHMGEIIIGTSGEVLQSILGSCVGIIFIWKEKNINGLAHCFLPESFLLLDHELEAKYVNQAISSLIIKMGINKLDVPNIDVIICGGGHSNIIRNKNNMVGHLNLKSARKHLKEYGFKFKEIAVEYSSGIQIKLDCTNYQISVRKFNE